MGEKRVRGRLCFSKKNKTVQRQAGTGGWYLWTPIRDGCSFPPLEPGRYILQLTLRECAGGGGIFFLIHGILGLFVPLHARGEEWLNWLTSLRADWRFFEGGGVVAWM